MSTQTDLGVVKPINKGAHVVTNSYEELNIVEDNGKAYIANKDVPADTPITSTEFWLNLSGTGMTEAQLQGWSKSTISDTNKIITEIEETAINNNITKNSADIATNTTAIATKVSSTDYATSTTGGVVKARIDGTTLYLTIDGTDA